MKQARLSEKDIVAQLPGVQETLSVMKMTRILSSMETKPLGDFEIQYMFDPSGVAAQQQ